MMNKKVGQAIFGVTGAAMLLGGCAQQDAALPPAQDPVQDGAVEQTSDALQELGFTLREEGTYTEVANVQGEFSFEQDKITPADELFSLFGTAATGICAKPGFAFGETSAEEYYVNVGGDIEREYSIPLGDLTEGESETRVMKCSCATGGAIANAQVTGVRVADILQMAEIGDEINTITFRSEDGYGLPMPLSYALEKDAMLVYQINGESLPDSQGAPLQVWMPASTANYFTRRVVDIELTAEAQTPDVQQPDAAQRAKVSILNTAQDAFAVGDRIEFEGYADDFDVPVAAVEFSLDGGKTWTSCETQGATADRWVYWHFAYVPEEAGTYKLTVRARTAEDVVSPLAASVVFTVE